MHALLLDWLNVDLHIWTWREIHVAAVGQVLFVALWFTRPWYRTWIGRALMIKSFSLGLYLVWAVWVIHTSPQIARPSGPPTSREYIAFALFGLITVGIWTQLGALSYEMWHHRKSRRNSA